MKQQNQLLASFAVVFAAWTTACSELAYHGDELASIEQHSYLGDLGTALGHPVMTGSSSALSDDYSPFCAPGGSADASYTWKAPTTGDYVFDTAGSDYDTVLEVRASDTGAVLGCNDNHNGTLQSAVTVTLSAGQSVIIIIDGFLVASGSYRLGISGDGPPTSGLHLWLRADAGVEAPGNRMLRWFDQSGNGRNATMSAPARQPFFVSPAINGRPAIRFAGAQSMYLDVFAQPTRFSVFVVGKNTSDGFGMILGPGGNAPNNQMRWESSSQALFVGLGNNFPIVTSPIGDNRAYHALSARYDGSTLTAFRNGNAMSSRSFTTSGPWILASVGSWYSTYFLRGEIAEIMMYDRALSDGERASVDSYLRGKYGLP